MPTPVPRAIKSTNVQRRFFCGDYERCLDTAIEGGWEGFTCERCGDFQPVQWNKERWLEDNLRCLALVYSIFKFGALYLKRPGHITDALEKYCMEPCS